MTREDAVDLTLLVLLISLFCFGAWNTHRRANQVPEAAATVISTTIEG